MNQNQTLRPWIWEFQLQILAPQGPRAMIFIVVFLGAHNRCVQQLLFFCEFAKLRMKIVSFVMSVCPSARMV